MVISGAQPLIQYLFIHLLIYCFQLFSSFTHISNIKSQPQLFQFFKMITISKSSSIRFFLIYSLRSKLSYLWNSFFSKSLTCPIFFIVRTKISRRLHSLLVRFSTAKTKEKLFRALLNDNLLRLCILVPIIIIIS